MRKANAQRPHTALRTAGSFLHGPEAPVALGSLGPLGMASVAQPTKLPSRPQASTSLSSPTLLTPPHPSAVTPA